MKWIFKYWNLDSWNQMTKIFSRLLLLRPSFVNNDKNNYILLQSLGTAFDRRHTFRVIRCIQLQVDKLNLLNHYSFNINILICRLILWQKVWWLLKFLFQSVQSYHGYHYYQLWTRPIIFWNTILRYKLVGWSGHIPTTLGWFYRSMRSILPMALEQKMVPKKGDTA